MLRSSKKKIDAAPTQWQQTRALIALCTSNNNGHKTGCNGMLREFVFLPVPGDGI